MAQRLYLPREQIFTNLAEVGAGFKLNSYETGTTTPKVTYSDTALSSANTNPIVADSAGRLGNIFVDNLRDYKLVLTDADDNTIWEADPVDPKAFSLNDFDPQPTSFWGTTAGTASAYTLTADPAITAYSSTQTFFFACHSNCNASATLAISGLSALTLKKYDGQGSKVDLEASDILSGQTYEARNDGTDIVILNPEKPYFDGRNIFEATTSTRGVSHLNDPITISNNSTDSDHDIDITAGVFDFDDGSGQARLTSALTKQFDATFELGDDAGGMVEGESIPTDGIVYLYQISNSDGSIVDIIGTTTVDGSTISGDSVVSANSLTKKKYLAAFATDGSANIRQGTWNFSKDGSYEFEYKDAILDDDATINTSVSTIDLTVPASSKVDLLLTSPSGSHVVYVYSPNSNEPSVSATYNVSPRQVTLDRVGVPDSIWTNSSSQIKAKASGASRSVGFWTRGWEEKIS